MTREVVVSNEFPLKALEVFVAKNLCKLEVGNGCYIQFKIPAEIDPAAICGIELRVTLTVAPTVLNS